MWIFESKLLFTLSYIGVGLVSLFIFIFMHFMRCMRTKNEIDFDDWLGSIFASVVWPVGLPVFGSLLIISLMNLKIKSS